MKQIKYIAFFLAYLQVASLHAWDCSNCVLTSPDDITGYPACQKLSTDYAPHCFDLPDDASIDVAQSSAKECIWPESYTVRVHWTLYENSQAYDGDKHYCEGDYEITGEGDYDTPCCMSQGNCVIEV